ncbi:MAG: pyruvate kinase [Lentimicrobiaceae bacterium]|nr:pyruvate kinase [Lentimicrobiaceae bacterium]
MKHTKIVASVSDLRCEVDFIRELYKAGVNVVRINTAHATPDGIRKVINNVREVSPYLAILIDTKGPEIRTTAVEEHIYFKTGDRLMICGNPSAITTPECVNVTYSDFVKDVNVGDDVLFNDGELSMKIFDKTDKVLYAEVQNDGRLGSRKSVNVPGIHIDLPALTEKDIANIKFAIEEGIDFIAHSFVRNKEDVRAVQNILDEYHSDIKIISKIENQEGVDNIDEIIEASYGIMIARGDLGIEVPIEHIPGIQRKIIRKCVLAKKPVIVATQMLHTMINNPRPTRAEVTDIANAIFYRTDALMLSGETASGKYPIEAVKTMVSIAEQAEKDKLHENDIDIPLCDFDDVTGFLSRNAIESTRHLEVKCIITDTVTGKTARNLSAYRASNPIFSLCCNHKIHRALSLSYGVIPVIQQEGLTSHEQYMEALDTLLQDGYISMDDKVAYLSGSLGHGGGNTFLEINKVRDIIEKMS